MKSPNFDKLWLWHFGKISPSQLKNLTSKYQFLLLLGTFFWLFCPAFAQAQVTGDTSLGTLVNGANNVSCSGTCAVTGGTQVGNNLFHSFREFSLPNFGDVADFQIPGSVSNIIARVTSSGTAFISIINGTIQTTDNLGLGNPVTANLFLLNPNGIVFQSGASINIGGAFLATTASHIKFADGTDFPATTATPLLTITAPIGLGFTGTEGSIYMDSAILNTSSGLDSFSSFALVGGSQPLPTSLTNGITFSGVYLDNSLIQNPGQRVELGAVSSGTAKLNLNGNNFNLDFSNISQRTDVTLDNNSIIEVSNDGGGDIAINARNVDITRGSALSTGIADNAPSGNQAGDITINATGAFTLSLVGSIYNNVGADPTQTATTGKAGKVSINAQSIALTDDALIETSTLGQGIDCETISCDGGNIFLTATNGVTVTDSRINSSVGVPVGVTSVPGIFGNSGNITITSTSFTLNTTNGSFVQAYLSTETDGFGKAGDITINSQNIAIDASSIYSRALENSGQSNGKVAASGTININTQSLSLTNAAQLLTSTLGFADAGSITIQPPQVGDALDISLADSSRILSEVGQRTGNGATFAIGNGGNIEVYHGRSLNLTTDSFLGVNTFGAGDAGRILVQADTVSLDSSKITSNVDGLGTGNGGNLTIVGRSLTFNNGSEIAASSAGIGNAGSVTLTGSDIVTFNQSSASTSVDTGGIGNAGNLTVAGGTLSLTNGGQLTASTSGQGNAGNLEVKITDTIKIAGVNSTGASSGLFSNTNSGAVGNGGTITVQSNNLQLQDGGVIAARSQSSFNGGDITINTNNLTLTSGGELLTTTFNSGSAGNITVNANNIINISGSDSTYQTRLAQFGSNTVTPVSSASGIFANTTANSTGKGGSIFLNTNNFSLADSASVSVDSLGKGNGGNLQIQAQDTINLSRQASLLAGTASGEGGNISLQAGSLLLMRYNSLISATAGGTGNGGNITINSPFIIGIPSENSDIIANAFQGRGGNINITTFAIYGLKYRPSLTPKSDITASSDFGVNGNVQINNLGIDATQGLTTLPTRLANVEEFKDRCQAEIAGNSYTFKISGKGGLPPSPEETLSDDTFMVNWATLPQPNPEESAALTSNSQLNLQNSPLIEAQGWVINPTGKIILTAQVPTATPNHSGQYPLACNSLPRSLTQVNPVHSFRTSAEIFTNRKDSH